MQSFQCSGSHGKNHTDCASQDRQGNDRSPEKAKKADHHGAMLEFVVLGKRVQDFNRVSIQKASG